MTQPFPNNPFLRGNFAPLLMECDAPDLVVHGEIPDTVCGVLYRNGPNPKYPPLGHDHHWFLGDGMVHAFFIENGRVRYRNRWVRTRQFELEEAAGRRLFSSSFNGRNDQSVEGEQRNVANTNIVHHGAKLLALDEGNPPVAMDARSLETAGRTNFDGKYEGPFTAHPKFDPESGEMLFFGYQAKGPASPDLSYGVVDAKGDLTRLDYFKAPFASMMHDFIATDEHVIFPVFPATIDVERIMKGGPVIAWDPDAGTHIGILARNAPVEDIRWFHGDPCYVFHPMNAHTEGTKVIAEVMKYPRVPLFPNVDGSRPEDEFHDAPAHLVRWTFDLDGNTDGYQEEVLDDLAGEFPRLDDRYAGLGYRNGFYAATTRDAGLSFDTIAAIDLHTGKRQTYTVPEGDYVMEPVFIPRAPGAAEGDGYLITLIYRAAENRSDLALFDTQDITAGPAAWAELPSRVPFGFHGNWVPMDRLA